MKILHIIWDLDNGGAQAYLSNLLKFHNKKDKVKSDVIVLTTPGVISDSVEKYSKQTLYLRMAHGFDLKTAIRLFLKIKNIKPTLIHVHTNTILVLVICIISNLPIVYTEHGKAVSGRNRRIKIMGDLIYKLFFRWVTYYIAVSETMKESMVNINPLVKSKVLTIPNGIDIDNLLSEKLSAVGMAEEGKKVGAYKIGVVGRLVEVKGLDLFLNIAAEIYRKNRDVSFYIVGDGELKENLVTLSCKLGIFDSVHFLGYRSDVMAIIKEFDVYLMTSHFESFGLTVVEAMGASVPVVAVKSMGSFKEIIDHDVNGYILNNRDPGLVSDEIIKLLKNKKLREDMGASAYEKVKSKYTMLNNSESILKCYEIIANN